jgi:hypothetical protein
VSVCVFVCVFVCSLSYPPCNAHAPQCCMSPVWLYSNFLHNLIYSTTFVKKVTEHKIYFLFSPQNFSETFLILRRSERDVLEFPRKVMQSSPFVRGSVLFEDKLRAM